MNTQGILPSIWNDNNEPLNVHESRKMTLNGSWCDWIHLHKSLSVLWGGVVYCWIVFTTQLSWYRRHFASLRIWKFNLKWTCVKMNMLILTWVERDYAPYTTNNEDHWLLMLSLHAPFSSMSALHYVSAPSRACFPSLFCNNALVVNIVYSMQWFATIKGFNKNN